MQWREVDAVFDALNHSFIDQRRFLEQLSAMDYAMSHRVYVPCILDLTHARTIRCDVSQNVVERGRHIAQRCSHRSRLLLAISHLNDRFATNAFHFAAQNSVILFFLDLLQISGDYLKL